MSIFRLQAPILLSVPHISYVGVLCCTTVRFQSDHHHHYIAVKATHGRLPCCGKASGLNSIFLSISHALSSVIISSCSAGTTLADSATTGWSWCRDELQASLKLLDQECNTAKAKQETANTCCQELEDKVAAEQSRIKHLQEQHDCEIQQRCSSSVSYA